jgi:hypothetical protein
LDILSKTMEKSSSDADIRLNVSIFEAPSSKEDNKTTHFYFISSMFDESLLNPFKSSSPLSGVNIVKKSLQFSIILQ